MCFTIDRTESHYHLHSYRFGKVKLARKFSPLLHLSHFRSTNFVQLTFNDFLAE